MLFLVFLDVFFVDFCREKSFFPLKAKVLFFIVLLIMQVKVGFLIIPLSLLFFKTSSEKTEKPNEKDSRKTKQPNLLNSVSQGFCFFYFFLLQDSEKNLFRSHDPKPEVLMREVQNGTWRIARRTMRGNCVAKNSPRFLNTMMGGLIFPYILFYNIPIC